MMAQGGYKTWFTAAELASLALPGLPRVKRKINELAAERRWALKLDSAGRELARPRAGRGGGLEYHFAVLPPAATAELIKRGLLSAEKLAAEAANDSHAPRDELWTQYARQPDKVKAEAGRRLKAIDDIEALERAAISRSAAVATVSGRIGASPATLWNWLSLVAGVPACDRLPRLAPQRKGGGAETEIHPMAWLAFKSDYLRPAKPTLASCHARLAAAAALNSWGVTPHVKTLQRKLEREVDPRLVVAKRQGQDALRLVVPAQTRTVADLHALQLVNIDGHRWDVFVRWPGGKVARPMMVAIQDVYSRKFLAWRTGETESAVQTRLAFADLFRKWGIPAECLLDNGRAFASKWITGGQANRYRFKVREEEPVGLLTSLGVKVHWATPYRGQSKPIERAFRDLCDHVARSAAFAGAYTGNKPTAKPEDYGSAAVPLETFLKVCDAGMAAHNAREGRRTEIARGRSFDAAFAESYASQPVTRATAEQLRLALLAADQVTADRQSGSVSIYGNSYWTPELSRVAGGKVTVRFDPDDLHSEVHVYDAAGAFVATAPVLQAVGFLDAAAAGKRGRQEAELRRTVRRAAELEQLLSPEALTALLPPDEPEDEDIQPRVVRLARVRTAAEPARRASLLDRLDIGSIEAARAAAGGGLRAVE